MTILLTALGCIAGLMILIYGFIILTALINSELIDDFIESQVEAWEDRFYRLRRK